MNTNSNYSIFSSFFYRSLFHTSLVFKNNTLGCPDSPARLAPFPNYTYNSLYAHILILSWTFYKWNVYHITSIIQTHVYLHILFCFYLPIFNIILFRIILTINDQRINILVVRPSEHDYYNHYIIISIS
jgi:hypothetical protein